MQRKAWLQRSLITAGAGLAGGMAVARVKPPEETEAERRKSSSSATTRLF